MLRVINWNLSYQGNTSNKVGLLSATFNQTKMPCVVALEEVTQSAYKAICEAGIFQHHIFSLNLRKQGKFESKNRGLGCLIGVTQNLEITDASLIERAPFPERAIRAKIKSTHFDFEVVCFHSLTGVHFKKAKSAHFAALADYLNSKRDQAMILCCDLNEPKTDHLDLDRVEFFDQKGDQGKYAGYILKSGIAHDLQDVYRVFLKNTSSHLFTDLEENTDRELLISDSFAASFIFRGGLKKRYDYIMASDHWNIKDVRYVYDKAIEYGSDHAMVVADLE